MHQNGGGRHYDTVELDIDGQTAEFGPASVAIAAITSCTNTSNPYVMVGAGLVAKRAVEKGLTVNPSVKTSFAPGSQVVTGYMEKSGLMPYLDQIRFNLVGYGCTTCIGNSGPLDEPVTKAIEDNGMVVAAVLSGNRNFEGRVHQEVRTNWLASPPLVVAYAIAGTTRIDLANDPIGQDGDGRDVFLADIWPGTREVRDAVAAVSAEMFQRQYDDVFAGPDAWRAIRVEDSGTYGWEHSTYIKQPPFFRVGTDVDQDVTVRDARILALLGDSVTTDHISPAGAIQPTSPAGEYLQQAGVLVRDFNSYGSRRGNHEVMMRGTFANIRIRNEMVPGTEGGYTTHVPTGEDISIYDAAVRYQGEETPLVVFAGKEYGTGSSRDWAAKGTRLLGVRAVVAESFERIHRSNLIAMGVLPAVFPDGVSRKTLGLVGDERVDLTLPAGAEPFAPRQELDLTIRRADGTSETVAVRSRIDTRTEMDYFRAGGILQFVLNKLVEAA